MIPYGDIRKTTPASGTTLQRAVAPANAFADRNQRPLLNFDDKAGSAAPSSGMNGSALDLYAPSWKAEIAQRDERAARLDKLPPAVQRLATEQGVTDLSVLEAVAIISRACKVMGGQAQVLSSDVGRAIGVSTQRADEILREAIQRGFIEPRAHASWRCKL